MTEYTKDFNKWNEVKKAIDSKAVTSEVFIHEKEIWWCSIGVNVGSEIDGKNELFERPVLIIRKINRDRLLIAPFTSKIISDDLRITAPCAGVNSQILLSQSKVISSKRLLRKIGHIKLNTYQKVIIGLTRLILGSSEGETPPYGGESRRPNGHGEHSIYL